MDSLQGFLDRFGPSSEAESIWLKNFFTFVQEHLSAAACGSAPSAAHQSPAGASCDHRVEQLSVTAVEKIQEKSCLTCSLPVSYRPLSVSELLSQQHLACVSNLSWSTNQHRAWLREAELSLPGQRALPRVNLLLIGWLREGRGGEWRLTDDSGNVRCEMVCPSPLWMNRPVFLPHWNYIPHDASGQDQDRGYLEVIGSPVLLCPRAEQGLAASVGGAGLDGAMSVREAAGVLRNRVRGQRVSVWGQVDSVCPLLDVSGSSFFFFSLRDDDHMVPVLVKQDSMVWWSRCVCVGLSVCVTALRVCSLRGWRGNNVLTVTHRSLLHTGYTQQHNIQLHNTQPDDTQHDNTQPDDTHTEQHPDSTHEAEPVPHSPADHAHSDHHLLMDHEGAEPEGDPVQSAVRIKQSRVISYQGVVTEVVSEGAGLYLMDRKVGLCLAYQPPERRRLRAGDQLELHHVHFLYRPCPDLPPSMLCCCLRSSLRVTAFSRVGGASEDPRCPADGVLPRLLLQHIRGMDQYLWTCHLTSQLAHSLVPVELHHHPPLPPLPQCVCLLSWKLSETLWTRRQPGARDIYSEMLDRPHRCPLNQYQVDPCVPQLLSVSDLLQSLRSSCWSSVSLRSLLPQDGSSLSRSEMNSSLSWSCRTLSSDPQTGDSLRKSGVCAPVLHGNREVPPIRVPLLPTPGPGPLHHPQNLQDPSVLIGCRVRGQSGVEVHSDSTIQVGSDWRFHTLTRPLLLRHTWTQTPPPSVLSVSQVLDCSSEVVTFQGLISERRTLMDGKGQSRDRYSGVRLTVCDQSGRSLCVYLDLSHAPYPPGLLPGNQVLLSGLLRKLSRSGGVYCSLSPVSCVTVTSLGDSCRLALPPPSPSMHLAQWAASRCVQGQVRGHVVGFLFLQLQWSCSLCGTVYRQVCSSQCGSSSAVFQSSAKLVIDDATAEAHVWLSGKPIQTVLGLADSQWEGLQRALRVRGHIRVFPRGRSLGTEGDSEDVLLHFLLSLCSSDVISQQVSLTCRKLANQSSEEVRRFSRGDRDFLTRMPRPLQLTCVHLETP
ncbi:CST complex subunit CTC1 isoform X4 [Fundulus heteroclitus]|uniref:CST complex subunit CTC1 isoform X4 n=1 Tax=Fundulus heteroclitus TaxID=8078 RepID=UPI00165A28C2|nr:CST complex subunit CTC1 isoform X4 [Fundulus heteroclitus]